MQYIALREMTVGRKPNRTVIQPGQVVPGAQEWANPAPWISRGYVKLVPDEEVAGGKWSKWGDYKAGGGVGHRPSERDRAEGAQAAQALNQDFARRKRAGLAPDAPAVRLPPLAEFLFMGRAQDDYGAFIAAQTTRAVLGGFRVEVRAVPQEELDAARVVLQTMAAIDQVTHGAPAPAPDAPPAPAGAPAVIIPPVPSAPTQPPPPPPEVEVEAEVEVEVMEGGDGVEDEVLFDNMEEAIAKAEATEDAGGPADAEGGPPAAPGAQFTTEAELKSLSKKRLVALAAERGLPDQSDRSKAEIITTLLAPPVPAAPKAG